MCICAYKLAFDLPPVKLKWRKGCIYSPSMFAFCRLCNIFVVVLLFSFSSFAVHLSAVYWGFVFCVCRYSLYLEKRRGKFHSFTWLTTLPKWQTFGRTSNICQVRDCISVAGTHINFVLVSAIQHKTELKSLWHFHRKWHARMISLGRGIQNENNLTAHITLIINSYRWTRNMPNIPQLCGARNHVFLLHGGSDGSEVPEIYMVEKVHDNNTIGKSIENEIKNCRSKVRAACLHIGQ